MSSVVIRKAELADIDKIVYLATEAMIYSQSPFRDTPLEETKKFRVKDLAQLPHLFGKPQLGLFVAEENGNIIGHVIVLTGTLESMSGEEQGWIVDLTVVPSHWGTGVARELALEAEKFVQQKGLKYIGLGVTSANQRAVRFYEKLGYAEERKRMIKVL